MSNQQKSNFAAHFFCIFLCRCFARLQRKTSRNFLITRFTEEMSYVFLFTFFPLSLIFIFLFSHRRYKISCCSSNKKCLLCTPRTLPLDPPLFSPGWKGSNSFNAQRKKLSTRVRFYITSIRVVKQYIPSPFSL